MTRAARPGRALRARLTAGAAPPRAVAVRARRRADRDRSRAIRWSRCWRPGASAPRPSWSPRTCSRCCAPACPPRRSSSCIARVSERRRSWPGCSPSTGSRSPAGVQTAFGHTALGRALLGAARCALEPEAARPRVTCSTYLRAPGLLHDPGDRRRRSRPRSAAGACGPPPRPAQLLEWEPGELDELAAAGADGGDPGPALCRLARRLLAAPHRRSAPPARSRARRSTPGRSPPFTARWTSWPSCGCARPAAELIELLAAARRSRRSGAGGAGDEVLLAEPLEIRARRFRAVFVCGLQEGEFPRPAAARAVPLRRAPPRAGGGLGAGAAPARGRAGRRALPVLRGGLARHRAGVPRLPQLRRGGQPRARLAVHRRRRRAAGRGLARAPAPAAAGRRRLDPADAPTERERARGARGRAGAADAGDEPDADRTLGPARPGAGAPQPDRLGRRARGVRRLPGEMAGRAPARSPSRSPPTRSR